MKKFVFLLIYLLSFGYSTPALAQRNIPILVYHSIDEYKGSGEKELYVTPANFEKQMKYLKDHGFTLLTFERWDDIHKVNKPIFLTFDDGYKNNLHVFDIFQKLASTQFKPAGTIFVISDFVGRRNRLSREELKVLAQSGYFSIQSHTATHPDLTKINNYTDELKGSKETIERMMGKKVIALSYPYGSFNHKVVEETKKYYSFGITTTPELFSEKGEKDELYYLPRMYVKHSTTIEDFVKMVE